MIESKRRRISVRLWAPALGVMAAAGITIGAIALQPGMDHKGMQGMKGMDPNMAKMMMKLQAKAPALGYLKAHKDNSTPLDLLGGRIKIKLKQKTGGVLVGMPDMRRLDPRVFGTPDMPAMIGGTPGITGVPPMFRKSANGQYTKLDRPTPFGDKFMPMGGANLEITAVDQTATDAATTKDSVKLKASWKDKDGNTYQVICDKVLPHGLEFPTFGGVVTNHMLHGFTGLGTPLMPTEYTYFGFWGMGKVLKNGEVLDAPRLVHGMLTEYVRADRYTLGFDDQITPTRLQFHLMVAPFKPDMKTGHFMHVPVKTGMKLPNGMELPFWHVMFENVDFSAKR